MAKAQAFCTHKTIRHKKSENCAGSLSDSWICAECKGEFIPHLRAAFLVFQEAERANTAEAEVRELRDTVKSYEESLEAQTKKYEACPHPKPIDSYGHESACACSHDKASDVCAVHAPQLKAALKTIAELREERDRLKAMPLEWASQQVCEMCRDHHPVTLFPGGWFHDGISEPSPYGSWPFMCMANTIRNNHMKLITATSTPPAPESETTK